MCKVIQVCKYPFRTQILQLKNESIFIPGSNLILRADLGLSLSSLDAFTSKMFKLNYLNCDNDLSFQSTNIFNYF